MPQLRYHDGTTLTDPEQIREALGPLAIDLDHWPVSEAGEAASLLAKETLTDDEKATVLKGFDHRFQHLKDTESYETQDLIVLHPGIEGLDGLLQKFDKAHYHTDPEVRYIVEGEGVFGFVLPNKTQVELLVEAGDYISVPDGTEHWFRLTEKKRIKAVRYFVDTSGWTPHYTGTTLQFAAKP